MANEKEYTNEEYKEMAISLAELLIETKKHLTHDDALEAFCEWFTSSEIYKWMREFGCYGMAPEKIADTFTAWLNEWLKKNSSKYWKQCRIQKLRLRKLACLAIQSERRKHIAHLAALKIITRSGWHIGTWRFPVTTRTDNHNQAPCRIPAWRFSFVPTQKITEICR